MYQADIGVVVLKYVNHKGCLTRCWFR